MPDEGALKRKVSLGPAGDAKVAKVVVRKMPPRSKAAPVAPKPVESPPPDDEEEDIVISSADAPASTFAPAPASPSAPAPASPSPTDTASELRKADSWRDFSDVDPCYAILGELAQFKVYNDAGELNEERLTDYLGRLTQPGVVEKPKDWVEVWAAMLVPVPNQAEVVLRIMEVGLESEIADQVSVILVELVKGHRCKIPAVQEAILTLFECGEDHSGCLLNLLHMLFPKSPTSEWGWSRVGWGWQQWWSLTDKILKVLEESSAFETLCELLRQLEASSGTYLPHQQIWDEKRLATVRAALCKYGGIQEDEIPSAVGVELS